MGLSFNDADSEHVINGKRFFNAWPFTIAAWIKPASTPSQGAGDKAWCSQTRNNTNRLNLYMQDNAGQVGQMWMHHAAQGIGDDFLTGTSNAISDTDWHHVCFVGNSGAHRIVLDGNTGSEGTSSSTNDLYSGTDDNTDIVIGADGGGSRTITQEWDGLIAWWACWDVALTTGEIQALANKAHPRFMRPLDLGCCVPLGWTAETDVEMDLCPASSRLYDTSFAWTRTNGPTVVGDSAPLRLWVPSDKRYFIPAPTGGFTPARIVLERRRRIMRARLSEPRRIPALPDVSLTVALHRALTSVSRRAGRGQRVLVSGEAVAPSVGMTAAAARVLEGVARPGPAATALAVAGGAAASPDVGGVANVARGISAQRQPGRPSPVAVLVMSAAFTGPLPLRQSLARQPHVAAASGLLLVQGAAAPAAGGMTIGTVALAEVAAQLIGGLAGAVAISGAAAPPAGETMVVTLARGARAEGAAVAPTVFAQAPSGVFVPVSMQIVSRPPILPIDVRQRARRLIVVQSIDTNATRTIVSVGEWSSAIEFQPGDRFLVELDGPSTDDVKASVVLILE